MPALNPWVALGVLVLFVLAVCGSFVAGVSWQKGRAARVDVVTLTEQTQVLQQIATGLVDGYLATTQELLATAARMDAIASHYEEQLDANDVTFNSHRAALAKLLAAHPDLADCRIGDDGVRLWAAAALGEPSARATRADPDTASGAMRGNAAGAGGRFSGSDVGRVDRSGEAVSPVQAAAGSAGEGGGRP